MHKGKRGQYSNIELWFLVAAFLIASVAGIDLLRDTSNALDRTYLEKNYIARDLAMTIEAVYASPGNLDYIYNLGSYRYNIDVVGGKVIVKDGESEVSYRVIGVPDVKSRIKMDDFVTAKVLDVKECRKPASIVLSKKFNDDGSSEISIAGRKAFLICKKVGDKTDEACRTKVVNCE